MMVLDNNQIHTILMMIAEQAYEEGREHQKDEDFPDVGMSWTKKFEDTEIYKTIKESKPK